MTKTFAGKNFVEDAARKSINQHVIDEYWQDKIARLGRITVSAYIVVSYTNRIHTHGSFVGFRSSIRSQDKWLRAHNTFEWPDYCAPEHVEGLGKFFDYYLKGIENDWQQTPRVRIAVLDPSHGDSVDRSVED